MAKTNLFKQFFGSMACLMLVGEAYASIEEGLTPNQRIMYDYVIHTANMTVNTDDVAIAMQDKGFIKENDVTGDLIKDKVPNMVEKDSNTGLISADVIPTITSDKLPNNVVTLNSNNKIDDNKLSENIVTMTTLNGYATTAQLADKLNTSDLATEVGKLDYATSTELTTLNNKLPTMDASTGAMTWTDPNGNSVSYGGYTFWVLNTYNKKISGSWFQCTTWTTDAPTSSWILQNEIQGLQCHSSGGWTYGTNCILDGTIETYNVPPAKFKYNLCKTLQSGDITALIDEQVTAKGYATTTQLADKLNTSDLATELAETANANAVKGIIAADSTVAKKSDLDGMITTSNIGDNIPNTVALKTDLSGYAALSSGKVPDSLISDTIKNGAAKGATALQQGALNGYVQTTNLKTAVENSGALSNYVTSNGLTGAVNTAISQNDTIATKDDLKGYVSKDGFSDALSDANVVTTGSGGNIATVLSNNNVITTSNLGDNLGTAVEEAVASEIREQGLVSTTNIGTCETDTSSERASTTCTGAMATIFNQLKSAINAAATGKQQQ